MQPVVREASQTDYPGLAVVFAEGHALHGIRRN
jgi:hypothetical protein